MGAVIEKRFTPEYSVSREFKLSDTQEKWHVIVEGEKVNISSGHDGAVDVVGTGLLTGERKRLP
ncbi:MAG TPA: hypothetical protein ENL46_00460 [Candidatus Aminicenantes bacterium]|nr:hypothetical protein [Candidatus Aminicenantes bacterium]